MKTSIGSIMMLLATACGTRDDHRDHGAPTATAAPVTPASLTAADDLARAQSELDAKLAAAAHAMVTATDDASRAIAKAKLVELQREQAELRRRAAPPPPQSQSQ